MISQELFLIVSNGFAYKSCSSSSSILFDSILFLLKVFCLLNISAVRLPPKGKLSLMDWGFFCLLLCSVTIPSEKNVLKNNRFLTFFISTSFLKYISKAYCNSFGYFFVPMLFTLIGNYGICYPNFSLSLKVFMIFLCSCLKSL